MPFWRVTSGRHGVLPTPPPPAPTSASAAAAAATRAAAAATRAAAAAAAAFWPTLMRELACGVSRGQSGTYRGACNSDSITFGGTITCRSQRPRPSGGSRPRGILSVGHEGPRVTASSMAAGRSARTRCHGAHAAHGPRRQPPHELVSRKRWRLAVRLFRCGRWSKSLSTTPRPPVCRCSRSSTCDIAGETRSMKPPRKGTTKRCASDGTAVATPGSAPSASSFASSGTSAQCFIACSHSLSGRE